MGRFGTMAWKTVMLGAMVAAAACGGGSDGTTETYGPDPDFASGGATLAILVGDDPSTPPGGPLRVVVEDRRSTWTCAVSNATAPTCAARAREDKA